MSFTLFRTEIRITPGAALFLAFCIVAGEAETLLLAALSLAAHEASHAIAARNLAVPVANLTVYPFGAVMRTDATLSDEKTECIVAAAGPLGSLTFAALLRLFGTLLPEEGCVSRLIGINLAIALFNLLPAYPLDGGRICRALLRKAARERTVRTLLFAFTALISLGMIGTGVYLVLHGVYAWTLFVLAPFLTASAFAEWRMPDEGIAARVMERSSALRGGTAKKAQITVIGERASIGEALAALSGSRYTILFVRGKTGFTEITEDTVVKAAAKYGVHASLKTAISGLTDEKVRAILY